MSEEVICPSGTRRTRFARAVRSLGGVSVPTTSSVSMRGGNMCSGIGPHGGWAAPSDRAFDTNGSWVEHRRQGPREELWMAHEFDATGGHRHARRRHEPASGSAAQPHPAEAHLPTLPGTPATLPRHICLEEHEVWLPSPVPI